MIVSGVILLSNFVYPCTSRNSTNIFNDFSYGNIVNKFRISKIQNRVVGLKRPLSIYLFNPVIKEVPSIIVVCLHTISNIGRIN